MMERYVKLTELADYLNKLDRISSETLTDAIANPVEGYDDAMDLAMAYVAQESEELTIEEIRQWADDHAISGDLILPTVDSSYMRRG